MKAETIFSVIIAVSVIVMSGLIGWGLHKQFRPCPPITHDTIVVVDETWHKLYDSLAALPPKEKIKWLPQDTLFIPADTFFKDVDTAAILKDYFSIYKYHWTKLDTGLLNVDLYTTVSRNMPIAYELNYQILQPQTIINNTVDNSVTYHKYLQFGLDIPVYSLDADSAKFNNINKLQLGLTYVWPKGYAGIGWQPTGNVFGVKLGATILKFKQTK